MDWEKCLSAAMFSMFTCLSGFGLTGSLNDGHSVIVALTAGLVAGGVAFATEWKLEASGGKQAPLASLLSIAAFPL